MKNRKISPLGIFAILCGVVAIAATVILILHDLYGLMQF